MTLKGARKHELVESMCYSQREDSAVVSSQSWRARLKHQRYREKGRQGMASGSQVGISDDHPLKSQFSVQTSSFLRFLAQTQKMRISFLISSQAQFIITTILEANMAADSQALRCFLFFVFNSKDGCMKNGPRIMNELRKTDKTRVNCTQILSFGTQELHPKLVYAQLFQESPSFFLHIISGGSLKPDLCSWIISYSVKT